MDSNQARRVWALPGDASSRRTPFCTFCVCDCLTRSEGIVDHCVIERFGPQQHRAIITRTTGILLDVKEVRKGVDMTVGDKIFLISSQAACLDSEPTKGLKLHFTSSIIRTKTQFTTQYPHLEEAAWNLVNGLSGATDGPYQPGDMDWFNFIVKPNYFSSTTSKLTRMRIEPVFTTAVLQEVL